MGGGWDIRRLFAGVRVRETNIPILNAPVHEVIVPQEDVEHFAITHPRHLGLIETPLAGEDDHDHNHQSHLELKSPRTAIRHDSDASSHSAKHQTVPGEPVLKRAHEASTIQLFFDLFFVANLTTFSGQHEIHDWNALRSYVGYFTIIWFTWFQNTMFDVRFSNDSAFERMCKAMQFGVMTGFAITGPGYQTGFLPGTDDAILAVSAYQTLSLILMSSRLVLTFQYAVALFWVRSYKRAVGPMLAHMAILFSSAMIFLGLYFAFNEFASEKVLAGWYVVVVLEAILILAISGKIRFLSFRSTVLVERLGLLTLIILGEGIISMCNALNAVGTDNRYTAQIIGQIICCVVITYFMWMLYFDAVQPERMGAMRQHAWAVLHFPFHASVVLVVEGMAQLAIWQKVVDVTDPLIFAIDGVNKNSPSTEQVGILKETIASLRERFLDLTNSPTHSVTLPDQSQQFSVLANATAGVDAVTNALDTIYSNGITFVCAKFKIETPESSGEDAIERANAIFNLFETVYIYFFIFAGFVLVLLSFLFMLGKRKKLRGEMLSVAVRMLSGIGLSMLALIAAPGLVRDDGDDNLHRYMYSGLMLPTVLIVYFIVIVLDNLLIRYVKSVVHWRLHLHRSLPVQEPPKPEPGQAQVQAKARESEEA